MTDRFDPRSPLPETPDAAAERAADPGCADDPYADGPPDAGGDDRPRLGSGWVAAFLEAEEVRLAGGASGRSTADAAAAAHAPDDDPNTPSPDDDTYGAQAGHIDPHAPRVRLAQLPPLPTLGSHRPGRREWCPARRVAFLQMLSASQSVVAAARSVGMSRAGAYRLRGRIPESAFVRAWNTAFSHGYDALAHAALNRAVNGVEVPHYYKGELVGTSRRYDERLTLGMLSMRGQIVHGTTGHADTEDGTWELLLHAVVEEAEDEIEDRAALAACAEESEADEA